MDFNVVSLVKEATVVVQLVMALLVVMSLASWSIMFSKLMTLGKAKNKVVREIGRFQDAGDLQGAIQAMGGDTASPTYQVAVIGVNELNRFEDFDSKNADRFEMIAENLRRALRHGVSNELSKMGASLSFLATCANSAPFIGLFGTVWGIMHSFHAIGQMKTAALAVIAPGISEALITTAIGLAVAIPAAIAYNYFIGLLQGLESELVNFAGVFLNRVQRELPRLAEEQASPRR